MHKKVLIKPDGRLLILYACHEIAEGIEATSPGSDPPGNKTHLRWHPLRGEWVAYASHRQNRTFLPPPEYNPLAPTTDPAHPTELPAGDYDVAVFENRGVEVAVTLHHPHGQIYAYPFIPPVPARELSQQKAYWDEHGQGLLEDLIGKELEDGRRTLYTGDRALAWMPAFARYSYEVWIAPRRPAPTVADLDAAERADFARALKTVLLKYDGLWGKPFPYIMVFHQAPTDGQPHPEAHLHIELYPAYRMQGRLKYLAGSEIGAGVFTADTLPEDKVQELRAVEVKLE